MLELTNLERFNSVFNITAGNGTFWEFWNQWDETKKGTVALYKTLSVKIEI